MEGGSLTELVRPCIGVASRHLLTEFSPIHKGLFENRPTYISKTYHQNLQPPPAANPSKSHIKFFRTNGLKLSVRCIDQLRMKLLGFKLSI
jgi:hypothetical protein